MRKWLVCIVILAIAATATAAFTISAATPTPRVQRGHWFGVFMSRPQQKPSLNRWFDDIPWMF